MKIVAVAAFAIASLNVFADSAKSIPSCEIGVKENKSAIHIQRTMKALEDSIKENPSSLVIGRCQTRAKASRLNGLCSKSVRMGTSSPWRAKSSDARPTTKWAAVGLLKETEALEG